MIVIESTGRKLKDAIDSGLEKLGKTLTEVEVEVIDHGGLFRKAKVRITAQGDEPVKELEKEVKTAPKAEIKREEKNEVREDRQEKRQEKYQEKREEKPEKPAREQRPHQERKERPADNKEKAPKAPVQKEEGHKEVKEARRYEPVTDELKQKAEEFVTALLGKMDVEAEISASVVDGELYINLKTETSTVIGYHGEVLDSIEYMTSYVINHEPDKFYHVIVDCNGYREKRKESLVALAHKMAAKCLKVRHKIVLEPMNSNERKIIHSALADNDKIITKSEGHEPNRHIVILCKKR